MTISSNTELLFLDGAMGTYLEDRHQVVFDHSKPGWSSNVGHGLLRQVHEEYAKVADVLLTATYQATLQNIAPTDDSGWIPERSTPALDKMHELVHICKSATAESDRHPGPKVALSLGPYGATMIPSTEYSGKYPATMQVQEALKEWHLRRVLSYVNPEQGPGRPPVSRAWEDITHVAFETLVSTTEILAVRSAMHELNNLLHVHEPLQEPKPFWICANFPKGTIEDPLTPLSNDAEDVARQMTTTGEGYARPWGIGVNCTKTGKIDCIVRAFERVLSTVTTESWPFLVLYPDGAQNLRYNATTKTWDPIGDASMDDNTWAAQMEALLKTILKRGKWPGILVGGCCKTTPGDIAELRQKMTKT